MPSSGRPHRTPEREKPALPLRAGRSRSPAPTTAPPYDRIRTHRPHPRPDRRPSVQRIRRHRRRLRRTAARQRRIARLHLRPAGRGGALPAPRHVGARAGRQGAGRESERRGGHGRPPGSHAALPGPAAGDDGGLGRSLRRRLSRPGGPLRRGARGRRHDRIPLGHHDQRHGDRPRARRPDQTPQRRPPRRYDSRRRSAGRIGRRAAGPARWPLRHAAGRHTPQSRAPGRGGLLAGSTPRGACHDGPLGRAGLRSANAFPRPWISARRSAEAKTTSCC